MTKERMLTTEEVSRFFWSTFFLTALFNVMGLLIWTINGSELSKRYWWIVCLFYTGMLVWGVKLPKARSIPERVPMLPAGILCSAASLIQLYAHQLILTQNLGFSSIGVSAFSLLCFITSAILLARYVNASIKKRGDNTQKAKKTGPIVLNLTLFIALLFRAVADIIFEQVGGNAKIIVTAYGLLWLACMFSWGFSAIYVSLKLNKEHGKFIIEQNKSK